MFRNFCFMIVLSIMCSAAYASNDQLVKKAIEDARTEFNLAVAQQGGWISTEGLLKEAELSLTKGEKDKALKLAKQAKHEAKLSIKQAKHQQKNWSEPAYIRQ